jgi:hypothetical protein
VVSKLDIWGSTIKKSPPLALLDIYLHNALTFLLGTSEQVTVEITLLICSEGAQVEF